MWVVSDEAMKLIMNGDVRDIVLVTKKRPDISILQLYKGQVDYKSYNGFAKYYKTKIKPIADQIQYANDEKLVTRIIKKVLRIK